MYFNTVRQSEGTQTNVWNTRNLFAARHKAVGTAVCKLHVTGTVLTDPSFYRTSLKTSMACEEHIFSGKTSPVAILHATHHTYSALIFNLDLRDYVYIKSTANIDS
jgi:hypothetical protein